MFTKIILIFLIIFIYLLLQRFGLIIPGQQKKAPVRPQQQTRPSIFDESSDSDDSDDGAGAPQRQPPTRKPGVVSGPSQMERRLARNMQEKALAEDASIFQYDELYDEMASKRDEAKEAKKQEPRKAKYIGRLIEHAERRKLENELRVDRQVQKDREAEGEMYKDKDTYVTATYRKKLESLRQLQEQEERDEYLEAIGDVTKQKDLDGFYRHLYEQKLGTQQPVEKPKTSLNTEEGAYKPIKCDFPSSAKQRTYRKRRASKDEEQATEVDKPATTDESKSVSAKAHLPNNIDADSDFSIDSSEDEEEQEEKAKPAATGKDKNEKQAPNQDNKKTESKESVEPDKVKHMNELPTSEAKSNDADPAAIDSSKNSSEADVPKVVKPPVDRTLIWRKRTVGEVFDSAVARYQERKLARRAWIQCNLQTVCALRRTRQFKYSPLTFHNTTLLCQLIMLISNKCIRKIYIYLYTIYVHMYVCT